VLLERYKDIIIKNIYRTDYLAPRLGGAVKQAIVDQLFSRTVLVGKETVRISHTDLSKLTGISPVTISKAMKELIKEGIIMIVGEYRPRVANEYKLNLRVPDNLSQWFSAQRNPFSVIKQLTGSADDYTESITLNLTEEGQAVVNSIKESMTTLEKELYRKKAREELILEGKDVTESNIENKITEIILRGFSDDKKRKYLKHDFS